MGICPPWHAVVNSTLADALDNSLTAAFNAPDFTLNGDLFAKIYCATDGDTCFGICANADIAGVGVRAAFYLNALMTAALVAFSPQESPAAAWSSTILTAAMITPAVVQKKQQMLTLYHATQVLDFATFSTIASLAVAPLCPIWTNINDRERPPHTSTPPLRERRSLSESSRLGSIIRMFGRSEDSPSKGERHRARIVLSFALIGQISLQWSWATYLFTSLTYAQTACNPVTNVVLFGIPFTARDINNRYFWVWALWLLMSISLTLGYGVLLVLNTAPRAVERNAHRWDPSGKKRKAAIFISALVACTLLMINAERQVRENCVLLGENVQWGFGQLAAMMFALSPAWPIVYSLREGNSFTRWLAKVFRLRTRRTDRAACETHLLSDLSELSLSPTKLTSHSRVDSQISMTSSPPTLSPPIPHLRLRQSTSSMSTLLVAQPSLLRVDSLQTDISDLAELKKARVDDNEPQWEIQTHDSWKEVPHASGSIRNSGEFRLSVEPPSRAASEDGHSAPSPRNLFIGPL